jgi:hypothetical protein
MRYTENNQYKILLKKSQTNFKIKEILENINSYDNFDNLGLMKWEIQAFQQIKQKEKDAISLEIANKIMLIMNPDLKD